MEYMKKKTGSDSLSLWV